ncbi:hypothetical protein HJC99_05480 [Candidatus Saccharibacteria bacterium]|nr:hypothetical protein [Candidatus Saccharibacteria bacterium]
MTYLLDRQRDQLLRALPTFSSDELAKAASNVKQWGTALYFPDWERLVGILILEMNTIGSFADASLPVLQANIDAHIKEAADTEAAFVAKYESLKRRHAVLLALQLRWRRIPELLGSGVLIHDEHHLSSPAMVKLVNARHRDINFWAWVIAHRTPVDPTVQELTSRGLFTVNGDWLHPNIEKLCYFAANNVPYHRQGAERPQPKTPAP